MRAIVYLVAVVELLQVVRQLIRRSDSTNSGKCEKRRGTHIADLYRSNRVVKALLKRVQACFEE